MCVRLAKTGVKAVSVILMLVSAVTAGAAVADIVYTTITICPATTGVCPTASSAVLLTYISSGVWASIFVCIITVDMTTYSIAVASSSVLTLRIYTIQSINLKNNK